MNELTLANLKELSIEVLRLRKKIYTKLPDTLDHATKATLVNELCGDIQTLLDLQKAEMHRDFRETLDIIKHGCYMRGEKEAQEVIELHRTKYKG